MQSSPAYAQRCTTRHAVILVAGESKRTRPLTTHRPKPLIPLLGQPLLAHILDELVGTVERVTLVVGYRAADIETFFGTSYRGIALDYAPQREVNGTASALLAVSGRVDEPFFLLYGDNLISRDDVLGVCRHRYSLAGLRIDDPRSFGVLDIADGEVRGIIEKPSHPPPNALANPGIYHFDTEIFPLLHRIAPSPRGEYELTDLIGLIALEQRVNYHICTGHWVPVGTPWEALNAAMFLLARRSARPAQINSAAMIAPDAEIVGSVTVGKAIIGAGARIIGPSYIADDCVVGPGALVEGSVLESGAHVGIGSIVQRSCIGVKAVVSEDCLIQSSWIDNDTHLANGVRLSERRFSEVQPVASVGRFLSREALATRGVIVSAQTVVPAGVALDPGTVV